MRSRITLNMDTFYAVDVACFLFQETKSSQTNHTEQFIRVLFKIRSNIGYSFKNSQRLLTINYFRKDLYLRYLKRDQNTRLLIFDLRFYLKIQLPQLFSRVNPLSVSVALI